MWTIITAIVQVLSVAPLLISVVASGGNVGDKRRTKGTHRSNLERFGDHDGAIIINNNIIIEPYFLSVDNTLSFGETVTFTTPGINITSDGGEENEYLHIVRWNDDPMIGTTVNCRLLCADICGSGDNDNDQQPSTTFEGDVVMVGFSTDDIDNVQLTDESATALASNTCPIAFSFKITQRQTGFYTVTFGTVGLTNAKLRCSVEGEGCGVFASARNGASRLYKTFFGGGGG